MKYIDYKKVDKLGLDDVLVGRWVGARFTHRMDDGMVLVFQHINERGHALPEYSHGLEAACNWIASADRRAFDTQDRTAWAVNALGTKVEIRIPFQGFYESLLDSGLDDALRSLVEDILTPCDASKINEIAGHLTISNPVEWPRAHLDVVRQFVPAFRKHLAEHCGFDLPMTLSALQSPKEYNYITDQLFVDCELADLLRLRASVSDAALTDMAKAMFTSRDGFTSNYDPDWTTWAPVEAWDHNQWYCAVRALLSERDRSDGWQIGTYYDIDFDHALGEGIADRNAVEAEVRRFA